MFSSERARGRLVPDDDEQPSSSPTRRAFLARTAGAGAAVTIGTAVLPLGRLVGATAQEDEEPSDAELVAFAESVELAAVDAYGAAAGSGLISDPAVTQALSAFSAHHAEHAAALAPFAGEAASGQANPTVLRAVRDQLSTAQNENDVLRVLHDLENALAATYLAAVASLEDGGALALVASMLPVEAEHSVAFAQALDLPLPSLFPRHPDPTKDEPNSFETKDRSLDPSAHPVATS